MLKLNNIGNLSCDLKDKTVSKVKKASSSIGDWLDKTYNNKETASLFKTPKLNSYSPYGNDPYEPSKITYKSSPKAPKQYANQAGYEKDKRKTTTVENIQKSLNTLGYKYGDEGELKVDGIMGPKTQSNWNDFNFDRGSENHLLGIYLPPLSPLDIIDNKSFKKDKELKPSEIGPASEDNFLFDKYVTEELKRTIEKHRTTNNKNEENPSETPKPKPSPNAEKKNAKEFASDMVESAASSIFALGDILKDAQLYDKTGLLGNEEVFNSLKKIGKKAANIGKVLDYGEFVQQFINKEYDEAAITLAGITGGTAGGLLFGALGTVAGGGIAGVGTGAMGAIAVSDLFEDAARNILEND